jgi:hypothetical protein
MDRQKLDRCFALARRRVFPPRCKSILSDRLAFGMGPLMTRGMARTTIFPFRRPLFGSWPYGGLGCRETSWDSWRCMGRPAQSSAPRRLVRLPTPGELAVTRRLPRGDLRCVGFGKEGWGPPRRSRASWSPPAAEPEAAVHPGRRRLLSRTDQRGRSGLSVSFLHNAIATAL